MHDVLREESAQATVEYAIVTVALLSLSLIHISEPTRPY